MIKRIFKAIKKAFDYLRQRRIESHLDPQWLKSMYEANKEWLDSQNDTNVDEEYLLRKARELRNDEKYRNYDIGSIDISNLREVVLKPEKKKDDNTDSERPEELWDDKMLGLDEED